MKRWIIIAILLVAAFFRIFQLSQIPPSASLDEASIGYNAYSILHTGADEYGTRFPLLLRAYDDFRPALYVYLVIPFVWMLGLGVIAVRLPSVILALVTIYCTYRIGRLIGKKYLSFDHLGEIAAVIVAISPWHIYISRLGHEANLGLTLVVVAVCFFLSGVLERKKWAVLASGIVFGLSVHGYQSEKVVTPLLLALGFGVFWKELWRQKWVAAGMAVICMLIALPAVFATFSQEGMVRFRGTSAFNPYAPQFVRAQKQYAEALSKGDRFGQIIHGKYSVSLQVFTGNYISHFAPGWLFFGGPRESFKVPNFGLMYLWELPVLLFGLWVLLKSKLPRGVKLYILGWIFIAPIPASITTQAPHAMRAYTLIPAIQLVEAIGLSYAVSHISKYQRSLFAVLLGIFVASGLVIFWKGYFVKFPKEQSDSFQYAMKDAVRYATQKANTYKKIEFSHQGNLYQSYMFFLYYSRYDPKQYQVSGGTTSGGYDQSHQFSKYAFGYLPRSFSQYAPDVLYFYDAADLPVGIRVIRTFTSLDGKPAIVAATLK